MCFVGPKHYCLDFPIKGSFVNNVDTGQVRTFGLDALTLSAFSALEFRR